MSFDTKLSKICDHVEIDEDHSVEPIDHKTVYLNLPLGTEENVIVKINGIIFDKNNDIEYLDTQDVSSQVNGVNSIFIVPHAPITDGSNKRRIASKPSDTIVRVFVENEDASEQFTGTENLLVTQHRRLMSEYNIFASVITTRDVQVKVNSNIVEIESIEPIFGKIVLKEIPGPNDTVTVSYIYQAKVISINGDAGSITIKEKPSVGQKVLISYYYLKRDGWQIHTDRQTLTSKIVFDSPKQTNRVLVHNEDVSSQIDGKKSFIYTEHYPFLPPRANLFTQPEETIITDIIIRYNNRNIVPFQINVNTGLIDLGFIPNISDTILITYNYKDENAPTDSISISYSVPENQCRKCKKTKILNDHSYDKLGQLITVSKEEKMLQDLLKLTTAIKGTNKAHPWYGTSLVSFIGTARLPDYYQVKFKSELVDAGRKLKDLQNQQTQYQQVDDEEFFSFMDDISVVQNDSDPNYYEISATVVSQAATAIEMTTDLMFNQQNQPK